jgi:hypothetical protein
MSNMAAIELIKVFFFKKKKNQIRFKKEREIHVPDRK